MALTANTLTYYEWNDIEKFLCEAMGIKDEYFRDYHKLVGGKYKDFWHVWSDLNHGFVNNDSYVSCWFEMLLDKIKDDSMISAYGDWILILKPALERLQEEIGGDKFYVHYCW